MTEGTATFSSAAIPGPSGSPGLATPTSSVTPPNSAGPVSSSTATALAPGAGGSVTTTPTHSSTTTPSQSRQIPLTCAGHTRPVVQLQFSSFTLDNNYLLISACKDGMPILRDGITGDWVGTFLGHKGAVWSAKLNRDTSRAITASADFSAKLWDTYTGQELLSFPHRHIVRTADFINDTHVVTGGTEKMLRIFDLDHAGGNSGQCDIPALELEGHQGAIKHVSWDRTRSQILSAGDDKQINVWDLRTPSPVHSYQLDDPITHMDLSADGEFVMGAAGKTIHFWDASSRQLVKSYTMPYEVSSVSIHPHHHTFVAGGSSDLWVHVYDFETGRELEVYKGHHGPIHTVSYSPDGEIYATGSEDGTIRLWQTTPGKIYGLWQPRRA
ncbi:hypothetical protein H4R33_005034 [Dimargaris cristalligena]|uniref:Serine-threonine kinase receptor-associated protein n=1 Tax=Dimargaris cristalligena TaxID=215637 RepID=A0A4P9ZZH6_9FUNG|nr:hypothetical protein H4R33_005034 [Dimargaris cristalligena]RKP38511.1 WD40-repeat-containing domain protein [Dimargaris cristalligena]|eukprot:RKP38511.1 WD40-repeat-containing domain protein [Dimargaris cristalligena]